jgi:hypothetical protein
MERGLVLRQHFFGAESDEGWNACKTVGELCNLLGELSIANACCDNIFAYENIESFRVFL